MILSRTLKAMGELKDKEFLTMLEHLASSEKPAKKRDRYERKDSIIVKDLDTAQINSRKDILRNAKRDAFREKRAEETEEGRRAEGAVAVNRGTGQGTLSSISRAEGIPEEGVRSLEDDSLRIAIDKLKEEIPCVK